MATKYIETIKRITTAKAGAFADLPDDERADFKAAAVKGIERNNRTGRDAQRDTGRILNSVVYSGLAAETDAGDALKGKRGAWTDVARSAGISSQYASDARKLDAGMTAIEDAGLPTTKLAASFVRNWTADMGTDVLVDAVRTLLDEGKRPTAAAIGSILNPKPDSETASDETSAGPSAVAESQVDEPESDAATARRLASELRALVDGGYSLPKAVVRHIETTVSRSEAAKAEAA